MRPEPLVEFGQVMTPLECARCYIARGWNPVPIPFRTKAPKEDGWQLRHIGLDAVQEFFSDRPCNIGIVLGPSSGGLTDIDLDCPEAISIASYLLPVTRAVFGRVSARGSHRLYVTALGELGEKAVYAYDDPEPGGAKARLVELRCGGARGAQTVFPGSVHESGEFIGWDEHGDPEPADGAALLRQVRLLAVASLLARAWPGDGARHDGARIVGGFLARARIAPATIKLVVEAIARTVSDPEPRDRVAAASDAAAAFSRGENTYGYPALREMAGDRRARRIADWIGYDAAPDGSAPYEAEDRRQDGSSPIEARPFVWRDPRTLPRRKWLYGTAYIRKYVSLLVAPGETGKSAILIVEALAMATGRNLLGVEPRERCRVWIYNLEDPAAEIEYRVHAAMLHYGIAPQDVNGWLFVTSGRECELSFATMARGGVTVNPATTASLVSEMTRKNIDVLIIDPLASGHTVEENSNVGINAIARELGKVADRTDGAIMLAHHSRKLYGAEGSVEDARGASSLLAAARSARVLNKMNDDEAARFDIERPRFYFRADNGKSNLAPPPEKADWYRLLGISLENGGGDPSNPFEAWDQGDSIQVATLWEPPSQQDLVKNTAQVLACQRAVFEGGPWQLSSQANKWVGKPIAAALGLDPAKSSARRSINRWLKIWIDNNVFKVVERETKGRVKRPCVEVGEWINAD